MAPAPPPEPRPSRPLPAPDDASAPFWSACARHELRMQACGDCGARRFPPRPLCPRCGSLASRWERVSGRGEVASYVICHPPVLPAFRDRTPYAVLLVALEDDPRLRLIGNLVGCGPERARVGLPVEVVFEDVEPGLALPQWRPRASRD